MRLALKFAYLGRSFHGYQRQPGVRTVEGDILAAMRHLGVAVDPRASRFQSASRTDAGVSALGNVLAVDTAFRSQGMCRALNSRLEDIWFWGLAEVGSGFVPRQARERWYRYHLPQDLDRSALRRCARLFLGCHDFRGFTKSRYSTEAEVRGIDFLSGVGGPVVDFRAPFFLWNMVRRMVGALEAYARGKVTMADVRRALSTGKATTGLAPAEPLVLMDVAYDEVFQVRGPGGMAQEIGRRLVASRAQVEILQGLQEKTR